MKSKFAILALALASGLIAIAFQNCGRFASPTEVAGEYISTTPTSSEAPDTAPSTPASFTAEAVGSGMVKLSWHKPPQAVTTFNIDWANEAEPSWLPGINTVGTYNTFTWSGKLDPGITYRFRIAATNAKGKSAYSEPISVTMPSSPVTVTKPVQANGVRFTNITSTQVDLAWNDNSDNEMRFRILRKKAGDDFYSELFDSEPNVTTYSDTGLEPDTRYEYFVISSNAAGHLDTESGEIVKTLALGAPAPATVPSGLSLTSVSTTQIDLSWNYNANDGKGVQILRAPSIEGSYDVIKDSDENSGSFSDTGLDPGTKYYYWARFKDANGNTTPEFYNDSEWTKFPDGESPPGLPTLPSNLAAEATSATEVRVTWDSPGCTFGKYTGFRLERRSNLSSPFKFMTSGEFSGCSDTYKIDRYQITPGTTYYYRFATKNKVGQSLYSEVFSVTTPP